MNMMEKMVLYIKKQQTLLVLVLSVILGTAIYILLFGTSSLFVTNVNWMYNRGGDSLSHQLGWMAFRAEPWSIKLGSIQSLLYPYGTSIVYADSVPMLAVGFKLFSSLLPIRFQYFGLWLLSCWILMVFFSLLIFSEINLTFLQRMLGAGFIALSPPLVYRIFLHEALCAQWLILAAIYLVICQVHGKDRTRFWPLLLLLGLWIHAYLFVMIGFFYLASLAMSIFQGKSYKSLVLNLLISGLLVAASMYTLGMFDSSAKVSNQTITNYSINLNTFYNPINSSTFIRNQKTLFDGQYEGYGYLGIGNLFILAVVILRGGLQRFSRLFKQYLPVAIPAIILFFIATAGTFTFGKSELFSIPLPGFIESAILTFRSVGRFIWPMFYLIVIFGLAGFMKQGGHPAWLVVLAAIQILDLGPLLASKDYTAFTEYKSPLVSQFWKHADEHYTHFQLLPDEKVEERYGPYAIQAVENQMTINWVYVARADYELVGKDMLQALEDVKSGKADTSTIYVTWDQNHIDEIAREENPGVHICREKDHWLIFKLTDEFNDIKKELDQCSTVISE